ncbi:HNH endonuclease [Proteiniclasticum sp. C24MP]|uniref:HNH endonuclease n=1 Tax=Proteiniclasticum sp. C24MP TaxID=3374101 RepID=UPI0037549411
MLLKSCRKCGRVIPYPKTYCDSCQPLMEEQKKVNEKLSEQRYNKNRKIRKDPRYAKFYKSKEWRTLSRVYLRDHQYKCEQCNKIATEVHHVVPIQTEDGWTRRLDYENLEAVCINCHNDKHKRFTVR